MQQQDAFAASGHPAVSAAAIAVLRLGGNAFDAVVAAGFASAVAEPALTSLGGGGFLLAGPVRGEPVLYDFFVDTPGRGLAEPDRGVDDPQLEPHFVPVVVRFPGSEQIFNTGHGSAAVPGTLAGLLHVHERRGRLELPDVLRPAVEIARGGVPLNAHQAYFLDLLRPIMTMGDAGRALFAPRGALLREGERLFNPDLAAFLETLPEDRGRAFYAGPVAERIVRDMGGTGLVTLEDLARYQVIERRPLEARYREYRLLTNPPPSFGGSLLALSLDLLAETPRPATGAEAPESLSTLARVMQEVDALRVGGCTGPEALSEPERRRIGGGLRSFTRGTTHVSVCDAEGNVASMTNSNGEGSGYVVPGTGIMLNNMLGEDDLHPDGFHASPPGLRVASMMSPSLLLRGDAVRLVLGSGGSKRIRTALLQVIRLVADFGLGIAEAVEHPRMHWDGELLQVEPGLAAASLEALRARFPVNLWPQRDVYFGGVHAVAPGRAGGGDPRRGGAVASLESAR